MAERHFVTYRFLKVDPAWRRLDPLARAEHKQEFLAACSEFGEDHLLQAFTTVGIRGDVDLVLSLEVENLERIHEFGVVLNQSGLMRWCEVPYSFVGVRKGSEYSDELRLVARPFRGRYVFIYPFVKRRDWYSLERDERWRVMQDHIRVGKEYPTVDNHTVYCFGMDDQEFVVAFDTDDAAAFMDLVHRLRATEASAYTERDTPSFTCIRTSVEKALIALDGEPIAIPTPARGA